MYLQIKATHIDIAEFLEPHLTEKLDKKTIKETPNLVHITISIAKRNNLSNYHKISGKILQLYLDEFCYKLNKSTTVR